MFEPLNFLADLVRDDSELYLAWLPSERQWIVRRHTTDGAMPVSKVLIAYTAKADALEDLRGAGFSTTHTETPAGELWTRDPRKAEGVSHG